MPVLTVVGEVGHRDLVIGFTVKDVDTGEPIPDASIHIRREDEGFCKDQGVDDFSIVCDTSGRGSYLVKSCMWSSTHGRFVNNFSMHLPPWWYLASAPGYAQSDELFLDDGNNNRLVKGSHPAASLDLTISLQRESK